MRIRWTRWILRPTVTLPGAPGHQVEHLRVTLGMHSGYEGVGTEYAGYPMGWMDILKLYPCTGIRFETYTNKQNKTKFTFLFFPRSEKKLSDLKHFYSGPYPMSHFYADPDLNLT